MIADKTASEVMDRLVAALGECDSDAAVQLFEEQATLAMFPGILVKGRESIRTFLEKFFSLHPKTKYEQTNCIEVGRLALFTAEWTILGPIPQGLPVPRVNHHSAILRKQADRSWLIAVDNPWGPAPASELPGFTAGQGI